MWISISLALTLVCSSASAQTSLKKQREALEKQIETTKALMVKAQQAKANSLSVLQLLQEQIRVRKEINSKIAQEVRNLNHEIQAVSDSIEVLNDALDTNVKQYGRVMRKLYIWKKQQPLWAYYVSSTSFADVFKKWSLLRQVEAYLSGQKNKIQHLNSQLEKSKINLEKQENQQEKNYRNQKRALAELQKDKEKQGKIIDQLKADEDQLKAKLNQQLKDKAKLDEAIQKAIEAARTKRKRDEVSRVELSKLASDFEKNRGRLPWPVDQGVVVKHFGEQPHATLSNITIINNGVDIATDQEAEVKAIFKGEVMGTVKVPGYQRMVIIQHGEYYSVYSRLGEVVVAKGQKVKAGETIGTVYTDPKSLESLLHIEIWKDKEKENPSQWLKK